MGESSSPISVSTKDNWNHFGNYIKLNVGNHLFLTSFDTLTKEDTMFKAMFNGRMEVVKDSEGKIVIDEITSISVCGEN